MARTSNFRPIGSEWERKDGMVLIKVTDTKWIYKQRYIWEQHNGAVPPNHYVIFLDGNKKNYDINNLACVSSRVASLIANYKLYSTDAEVTQTGIDVSKLLCRVKELKGIKPKSKHRKKGVI